MKSEYRSEDWGSGDRFTNVFVTVDNGVVRVDPEVATVYPFEPDKPDSVRWVINLPDGVDHAMIKWQSGSPFYDQGVGRVTQTLRDHAEKKGIDGQFETVLIASGSFAEAGLDRYSILFVDRDGQVKAGIDPWVKRMPPPPKM